MCLASKLGVNLLPGENHTTQLTHVFKSFNGQPVQNLEMETCATYPAMRVPFLNCLPATRNFMPRPEYRIAESKSANHATRFVNIKAWASSKPTAHAPSSELSPLNLNHNPHGVLYAHSPNRSPFELGLQHCIRPCLTCMESTNTMPSESRGQAAGAMYTRLNKSCDQCRNRKVRCIGK